MNRSEKLLNIVIIVILICVIAGSLIMSADKAKTVTAVTDSVESKVSGSGIITVNSVPVVATKAGKALFAVEEGKVVKRYTTVANVYSGEIDEETGEKLRRLNDKLAFSRNARQYEQNVFDDIGSINKEINRLYVEIINLTAENNYTDVYGLKSQIKTYHDKILKMKGETPPPSETVSTETEIAEMESRLSVEKVTYSSPSEGVFSSSTDNFDELLSPQLAKELTPAEAEKLLKTPVEPVTEITEGKSFAKIINGFEWYLVSVFEEEEISELSVGSSVKLRITSISDSKVPGSVVHISPAEKGKVVAVIKSTHTVDGIYFADKVDFEIVKTTRKGLKIPVSCLIKRDGGEAVMAAKNGIYRMIPVDVIFRDKNYVIIEDKSSGFESDNSHIIRYDLVVTNPGSVNEGDIAGGAV